MITKATSSSALGVVLASGVGDRGDTSLRLSLCPDDRPGSAQNRPGATGKLRAWPGAPGARAAACGGPTAALGSHTAGVSLELVVTVLVALLPLVGFLLGEAAGRRSCARESAAASVATPRQAAPSVTGERSRLVGCQRRLIRFR